MTKQTKVFSRTLALVLTVLMLVVAGIFAVTAADDVQSSGTWGGIDWTLTTDGTLTISPTNGEPTQLANKKTAFKVGEWPEAVRYDSKGSGAAIEGWPYNRAAVKKLVIKEGVTSIGSFAAQGFTNLTGEVVIPSTVTYIGQEAFQYCTMTQLTFAEGGTESLTIAQGGLKNLPNVEEIELPADRSAIYLKAWVFNNCDNLKHISLPANVLGIGGTNQVDYLYFSTSHNSGNYSALTYYNDKLEAITFGSEAVRDLYFTTWGNPITTIGDKNSYKTAATVASVGLTYGTSVEAVAKYAKQGDTITLLKNTEETFELPAGVQLDENGFTAENVTIARPSVAQIGTQGYETLAKALENAAAGDTITFLADITEDVTVNKAITIDGAGKTYTGKMTLKADTTIQNVNFDGKSSVDYAVVTGGANYVTIEGCTAKNYTYGFVQLSSGTALTTVKNVTVSNMNYGVKVDYSNAVVLENVDINVNSAAVLNSNYGEKTITIKNSKLNILGTWKRNDTKKTNYVFEGANTINSFVVVDTLDNFKLVAGATLTAPNDVVVTTDVEGYSVKYEGGKYIVKADMVAIGEETYASLAEALAAAQAGD
ncbi:MAG: leucine-rich repeat protein, partial [Phascolarctobacterium sp.]|nr:leucine-rich repeat protein [Phascolarctobacterium sp.]